MSNYQDQICMEKFSKLSREFFSFLKEAKIDLVFLNDFVSKIDRKIWRKACFQVC